MLPARHTEHKIKSNDALDVFTSVQCVVASHRFICYHLLVPLPIVDPLYCTLCNWYYFQTRVSNIAEGFIDQRKSIGERKQKRRQNESRGYVENCNVNHWPIANLSHDWYHGYPHHIVKIMKEEHWRCLSAWHTCASIGVCPHSGGQLRLSLICRDRRESGISLHIVALRYRSLSFKRLEDWPECRPYSTQMAPLT